MRRQKRIARVGVRQIRWLVAPTWEVWRSGTLEDGLPTPPRVVWIVAVWTWDDSQ